MTTILNLPDELLFMICEKLSNVVDIVNLSFCSKRLNFICKGSNITNSNVYKLNIVSFYKTINLAIDFNKRIKLKLNLSFSNYISDVSNLGKVHTLDLSDCINVTDVSMLGKVHYLDLSHCIGVTDVSNLSRVHTLNLYKCKNVKDVSMLGNSNKYNLIVANFANADMVGHTGDFEAAKKAIKFTDTALDQVVTACLKNKVPIIITADHGNSDQMLNPDGSLRTAHSTNPVPCLLVSEEYKNVKLADGALCDLAPTLLELMNLEKPKVMLGKSLISK
jgi:hypothetical protein